MKVKHCLFVSYHFSSNTLSPHTQRAAPPPLTGAVSESEPAACSCCQRTHDGTAASHKRRRWQTVILCITAGMARKPCFNIRPPPVRAESPSVMLRVQPGRGWVWIMKPFLFSYLVNMLYYRQSMTSRCMYMLSQIFKLLHYVLQESQEGVFKILPALYQQESQQKTFNLRLKKLFFFMVKTVRQLLRG